MVSVVIRPFLNYLVYGSADPIFQDFEEKNNFLFLNLFFCYKFSVVGLKPG